MADEAATEPRLPLDLPPIDTTKLDALRGIFGLYLRLLLERKRSEPPYPDSELVPLHVAGLPVSMVCAMLEGIGRRYPEASWVANHGFGEGPMVLHLGPERYDFDDEDDWEDEWPDPPRPSEDVQVKGGVL